MPVQQTLIAGFKHDKHWQSAPYESDQWASTDRGWIRLLRHPDGDDLNEEYYSHCCGNYLDYGHLRIEHPAEGTVHACAYVHRVFNRLTGLQSTVHLGSKWCASVDEAINWIESQVTTYLQETGSNG
jgi:hypothetical protein